MANHYKPKLVELDHEQLLPGRFQMRQDFDPVQLDELAVSIRSSGLLQPIVVRELTSCSYEIVAGERRWRACKLAGMQQVPCLLNIYSDAQVAAAATIENINRVNLNPIEEAEGYRRLVEEFAYTHEEVASITGKSRSKISNMLRLLKLSPPVRELLQQSRLMEGHAKLLGSLTANEQTHWGQQAADEQWSVRALEQALSKRSTSAPKNTNTDPNLKRLSDKLSMHMGCKVNISHSKSHTRMEIDCHDLEVFAGVLEKMKFDSSDV